MDFFSNKILPHARWILLGIAGVFMAFLIFHVGLVLGSHRGARPHPGGMRAERGFSPSYGLPPGFVLPDSYMPGGHGAVGTIATVTLPTLTITEPNGDSETVFLSTTTVLESQSGSTDRSALIPGVRVIIFGSPDETIERINAKVIHILP